MRNREQQRHCRCGDESPPASSLGWCCSDAAETPSSSLRGDEDVVVIGGPSSLHGRRRRRLRTAAEGIRGDADGNTAMTTTTRDLDMGRKGRTTRRRREGYGCCGGGTRQTTILPSLLMTLVFLLGAAAMLTTTTATAEAVPPIPEKAVDGGGDKNLAASAKRKVSNGTDAIAQAMEAAKRSKARKKKERKSSSSFKRRPTQHEKYVDGLGVDEGALRNAVMVVEGGGKEEEDADPREIAKRVLAVAGNKVEDRLTQLFANTQTDECRTKIATHYARFLSAMGKEEPLPFASFDLHNECTEEKYDFANLPDDVTIGDVQGRTYQPDVGEYLDDWKELRLLYVILTHDSPESTVRLIDSLTPGGAGEEEGCDDGNCVQFVIHVDGKRDDVQRHLADHYADNPDVHLLPDDSRVRVNWGGFSMVNATLQSLKYAFAVDRPGARPLDFQKVVHMASTSYPLKSNTEIRRRIASYPLDANFFDVVFKPTDPSEASWHYFVECDDAVHRIYRLPALKSKSPADNGVDIYTASQWWISSREFAQYLAEALPGTFVRDYLDYAEHVVVADEAFFGTVLRHTPFCHSHHNDNWLHLQFDRWENELQTEQRDKRKCVMPRPDHCGRSPTTMTLDYLPILEVADDLFARKFVDDVDSKIKDVIDRNRARDEARFRKDERRERAEMEGREWTEDKDDGEGDRGDGDGDGPQSAFDPSFEGHGVLIVARETLNDVEPLCLGLGESKNKLRLVPCFHDFVVDTLSEEWATGAVIEEEVPESSHARWELGPCSTDGELERMLNGTISMKPGIYSPSGPMCMLKQMDGIRRGRCADGESDRTQPGGEVQVFPCRGRWHQFFSFGNGDLAPLGSIHMNLPAEMLKRIQTSGRDQAPHMCMGVWGRGDLDETEWEEDVEAPDDEEGGEGNSPKNESGGEDASPEEGEEDLDPVPLWEFKDDQVVTTRCDNADAVIEWVFVPFIVEDEEEDESDEGELQHAGHHPAPVVDQRQQHELLLSESTGSHASPGGSGTEF